MFNVKFVYLFISYFFKYLIYLFIYLWSLFIVYYYLHLWKILFWSYNRCRTRFISPTKLLFCKHRPVPEVLSFLCVPWLPGPDGGGDPSAGVWRSFLAVVLAVWPSKMLPAALTVLLTLFSFSESKQKDFYTFKVVNSRGKLVSLEKYRGSVSLVGLKGWTYTSVSLSPHECMLHEWMNVACS